MSTIPIYCINLDSRKDRWARFISQPAIRELQTVSADKYQFQRFSAVYGKEIDIQNDKRISVRTKRNILFQKRRSHEDMDSAGAVGCYLSHAKIWEQFLNTNAPYCIVLEDDAVIPDDFLIHIEMGLESLEQNKVPDAALWNLSIPHGNVLRTSIDHDDVLFMDGWASDIVCPTTGYVLFRDGAKKLLETAFPMDGHVDMYIWRCTQIGMFHTAHYKNLMLSQVAVKLKDSNIQGKVCEICDLPTKYTDKNLSIFQRSGASAYMTGVILVAGMAALYGISRLKK
jgi:GR25 family glycosyltransferase involved in LPS biosynthesis